MIEKKTIRDISSAMRGNFQKAVDAMNKKNIDYAIMLFKGIVQKEPGFIEAREKLRAVEKIKTAKLGFLGKMKANMKAMNFTNKGKMKLSKAPMEAMKNAEEALSYNLSYQGALLLLAQCGEALEAPFISVEAMEIAAEYHPKDENVLDKLAEAYEFAKMGTKALATRQKIAALDPNNMAKQSAVRAAAALATMEEGHWEDNDADYRAKLKNKDEAVQMEQQEKIVRGIDDVKLVIEELEGAIANGDDSHENHRKLADMYQRAGEHDKALEHYHKVVEIMGTMDPYIDASIEKSELAKLDAAIEEWKAYAEANPDKADEAEQNIAQIEQQKLDYSKERAAERVKMYPNDTELRYLLGVVCWNRGEIDEAIQAFQVGQRNPSKRLSALVYLGRCFMEKGQYDIAIEQLTTALEGMLTMNKEKMEALYYLGNAYEALGNKEEARNCYKQIYKADISYRDVEQRIQSL